MSKILIIEPYKLLQYAFVGALCGEHELSINDKVSAPAIGADLALIDGAALREWKLLSVTDVREIEGWKMPVIWLDHDDQEAAPAPLRATRATLPLDKEALKQALLAVRSVGDAPNRPASAAPADNDKPPHTKRGARPPKTGGSKGESPHNVIELVDVVEEDVVEQIVADADGPLESLRKE